ncbi:MAG: DUF4876 domain-containing protein [Candidatus Cryptobacteroides sp.]
MKRLTLISSAVSALLIAGGCEADFDKVNPYGNSLHTLEIRLAFPERFSSLPADGLTVQAENIDNGSVYSARTDGEGTALMTLVNGLYRVSTSPVVSDELFNGSADGVRIAGEDRHLDLELMYVKTGDIVIKEIYCGGCKMSPYEGNYQADKYIILHNNTGTTQYLDSLCFGSLSPYNSNATNPWVSVSPETGAAVYRDFVPVIQAVWQFPGDGKTFPLDPGEDAVIAVNGAIDHSAQYPLSVDLNREDCFVCYNTTYFTNVAYHPAPGDKIRTDHYLDVVIKTGQANAYPLSINSPAVVIFKARGRTIQEFVLEGDVVIPVPGSSVDNVVCVPLEWVLDAVEVFNGGASNNRKRIHPTLDAGFVYLSDVYLGHTLMRKVNEEKTATEGFEVLVDTNNSSNDFYESQVQSLHKSAQKE